MSNRLTMRVKGLCPKRWLPTMAPSTSGEYVTYRDWRKEWRAKKALEAEVEDYENRVIPSWKREEKLWKAENEKSERNYISAVNGRKEFRKLYKESKAENKKLKEMKDDIEKIRMIIYATFGEG